MKKKFLSLLILLIFALAACGGDIESAVESAQNIAEEVVDSVNDELSTTDEESTLEPTAEPAEEVIEEAVEEPAAGPSDRWAGTTADTAMAALGNATISINGVEAQSDGSGNFELYVPRAEDGRYVINAELDGYAPVSQIHIGSAMEALTLEFQQVIEVATFDPTVGVEAEDPSGTQISVGPNQLEDADGNEPTGDVTLNMYTYDLTQEEMVGDMSGVNDEGQEASMESAGAFYASFEDEDGNELNVKEGETVEISVPVVEERPNEVLTVWSYDPETGLWVEEGVAMLEDGRYVAEVSHFSYWNFDWEKRTPSCIKLEVEQSYLAANNPLNVRAVLQTNPTRVRDLVITQETNVLINLPNNTDVQFFATGESTPFATISSGAAWGGVGIPSFPYGACNGVATVAPAPEPVAITIGTVIHLENGFPNGGYLDTRGRIIDKEFFNGWSPPSLLFVSTNSNLDRDNGSGSWQIVSADGKADGEPLLVGDSIHLLNLYPNGGFLDTRGYVRDLTPYAGNVGHIGVFTANSPTRDSSGSGTWIIESASGKAAGEPLVEGDAIHLRNSFSNGGYLDTSGYVTDNPTFTEYSGQALLVFTNLSNNRDNGSGTWMITLSGKDPIEVAEVPVVEPTVAPPTTGSLQGQVIDATTGSPLEGVQVCVLDQCVTTGSDGNYTINDIPVGQNSLQATKDGYIPVDAQPFTVEAGQTATETTALSPELAQDTSIRIVLTWDEVLSDLDAYLQTPSNATISYGNLGSLDSAPFAKLDIDNIDAPAQARIETVTIELQDGTYTYWVNNVYPGEGGYDVSKAHVQVLGSSGVIQEFTPPAGQSGAYWHVFTMDGAGNITEVNTLSNSAP